MADPANVLYVSVGTFYLVAAAALLRLNFADRLNRAFSLYLVLEGGAMVVYAVPTGVTAWQNGIRGLFSYLTLGAPFALLYLAACYRERFGKSGLRRGALVVLALGALLTELVHFVDHGAFYGTGARPWRPTHYLVTILGPAVMAALLASDGLDHPSAQRRRYLLNASLAFAFYPTAFALHLFIPDIMNVRPLEEVAAVTALAPIAYVLLRLGRVARRDDDPSRRHAARKYLAVFSLAPASVAALGLVRSFAAVEEAMLAMRFVMTGWLVVFAALVAYAILRHSLFGIERGLKWTIRRSFVPALILSTFFVVEKTVEWAVEGVAGAASWVYAGVLCGLIALGYRPLQQFADRFADAAMPEVAKTTRYSLARRRQMYEAALAAAWEDGRLEAAEHRRLHELRRKLHLADREAQTLEEEFLRRERTAASAA